MMQGVDTIHTVESTLTLVKLHRVGQLEQTLTILWGCALLCCLASCMRLSMADELGELSHSPENPLPWNSEGLENKGLVVWGKAGGRDAQVSLFKPDGKPADSRVCYSGASNGKLL